MNDLTYSQDWFRTILSHIEDAVIATNIHGEIIFMNKTAEQLTGWSASTASGQSADQVFILAEPVKRDRIVNPVESALASGKDTNLSASAILISNNKSELQIEYRTAPITDHDGVIQGIALIFSDKTEQKKIEDELQNVRKELEAFSHTISHDMRAPLRAIKGYASILEEDFAGLLGEEGRNVLGIISKNTLRMDAMIDDLLEFSQLGREKIVLQEIDVHKVVNIILKDLQESSQHHADILLHELPPALGDQNLIVQVWRNLLSNAFKFTAKVEKPKIEIGYKAGEFGGIYFIKDNGAGFDMKYSDRLFGVFQRLHKASEFEGSGVGLAIVRRIISKHGGSVWGEGETNAGSTFYFALPKKNN